jgi:hypothetical protein|tara:strand:- start:1329 stop:1643 length:315 start_codon:yes stop_codon:yes gene_type:complete
MADEELDELKLRIKLAIEQLNGKIPYKKQEEIDKIELLPEVAIKGTGIKFCFSPGKRRFVKICRGQKAYIIDDMINNPDKCLVYTWDGFLVEIEFDELSETGFD